MKKETRGKGGAVPPYRPELATNMAKEAQARIEGAVLDPFDIHQLGQQQSDRPRNQLIMVKSEQLLGGLVAIPDSALRVQHHGGWFTTIVAGGGCRYFVM